jgi:hypothetical protein
MTRNLWQHVAACSAGWNLLTLVRFRVEPPALYIPDAIFIVVMVVAIYKGFIQENAVH